MVVKRTLTVSVSVTITVPSVIVLENAVPVLAVVEVSVPTVVTPVSVVVSLTEEVTRLVVVLVDRIEV